MCILLSLTALSLLANSKMMSFLALQWFYLRADDIELRTHNLYVRSWMINTNSTPHIILGGCTSEIFFAVGKLCELNFGQGYFHQTSCNYLNIVNFSFTESAEDLIVKCWSHLNIDVIISLEHHKTFHIFPTSFDNIINIVLRTHIGKVRFIIYCLVILLSV